MKKFKVQSSKLKVQGSKFKARSSKSENRSSKSEVQSSESKIQGSRFTVKDFKIDDRSSGNAVQSPKSKVQSPKSAVQGSRFKVQGSTPEAQAPKFEARSLKFEERETSSAIRSPQSAVLFGVLPILEALRAENRRIEKIFVADGAKEKRLFEILDLAQQKGVHFQKIPRENFSRYVESAANHQGVVALVAAANYVDADALLEEIYGKENALLVILDGVEDPRNLGAILRAVECAGADGVFIPERRAVGLTETVAKSSAGATEYVKVAKVANVNRLIEQLKRNNIWVVGASGSAETAYANWDWTRKTALVLGGEGRGLHRLVAEKCDALVKIPMRGRIESLNVSVACGVMLFEAVRQRESNG